MSQAISFRAHYTTRKDNDEKAIDGRRLRRFRTQNKPLYITPSSRENPRPALSPSSLFADKNPSTFASSSNRQMTVSSGGDAWRLLRAEPCKGTKILYIAENQMPSSRRHISFSVPASTIHDHIPSHRAAMPCVMQRNQQTCTVDPPGS